MLVEALLKTRDLLVYSLAKVVGVGFGGHLLKRWLEP